MWLKPVVAAGTSSKTGRELPINDTCATADDVSHHISKANMIVLDFITYKITIFFL